MQKILLTLALVALCAGQNGFGSRPFPVPTGSFNGTSSFGVSTSTALTSFAVAAGGISTSGVTSLGVSNIAAAGLSVEFTVSSSAAGSVNVTLNTYTGGSLNGFAGISSGAGSSSTGSGSVSSYFGFTVNTTLAAGTYQINATIRPTLTATLPTVSANLQLFYSASATDGSNSAYSNGAYRGNFFGALPSTISYNGNAATAITFNLPTVQSANVIAASVDLSVAFTANTTPVFPVLYGTAARVLAGARALYVFSTGFAISLFNAANTTITATANTAYNSQVSLTAGTSTTVGGSGSFNGFNYNLTNTAYANVSFNVSVQQQTALGAQLVYNTTGLALAAGRRFVWAFYNETTGTAQILTDSLYDSVSATVSINVTHFSTYSVYQTADQTSSASTSGSTSTTSTSTVPSTSSTPANGGATTVKPSGATGAASAVTVAVVAVLAAVALVI